MYAWLFYTCICWYIKLTIMKATQSILFLLLCLSIYLYNTRIFDWYESESKRPFNCKPYINIYLYITLCFIDTVFYCLPSNLNIEHKYINIIFYGAEIKVWHNPLKANKNFWWYQKLVYEFNTSYKPFITIIIYWCERVSTHFLWLGKKLVLTLPWMYNDF